MWFSMLLFYPVGLWLHISVFKNCILKCSALPQADLIFFSSLQVDPKFMRNLRFAKKHNKKGLKTMRKAAKAAVPNTVPTTVQATK